MIYNRNRSTILVIILFSTIILLSCTHNSTQSILSPNINSTEMVIPTTTNTQYGTQKLMTSPLITSSVTPSTDFPASIYPPPKPFLKPVNGITTNGCPDLADVGTKTDLPSDTVIELIDALRSGDLEIFKKASDQTYWPAPQVVLTNRENVNPTEIQIHPAIQTPYDGLIRTGCGQETLDLSWWVDVGTGALGEHYFLINRSDTWLVWASYP
jgi:hypothetical protein